VEARRFYGRATSSHFPHPSAPDRQLSDNRLFSEELIERRLVVGGGFIGHFGAVFVEDDPFDVVPADDRVAIHFPIGVEEVVDVVPALSLVGDEQLVVEGATSLPL